MASYVSDVQASATIFTGFVTSTPTSTSASGRYTAADAGSTTAGKGAPIKMKMIPGTTPAAASTNKAKLTGMPSTSAAWHNWVSWAKPTAYTAAMKLSGGTFKIKFSRATGMRAFIEAYNSAGVRQASVNIYSATGLGTGSNSATVAIPTTKAITVPASGYAVIRAQGKGNTSRSKMTMMMGQTANGGMLWTPTEAPAVTGPPTEIRDIVKDATGTVYADGTSVHVYNSDGTLAYTGTVGTTFGADTTHASIAAITAGTGTFSVTFANADVATRSVSIDAAVDTDGLITNLITPTQLV